MDLMDLMDGADEVMVSTEMLAKYIMVELLGCLDAEGRKVVADNPQEFRDYLDSAEKLCGTGYEGDKGSGQPPGSG